MPYFIRILFVGLALHASSVALLSSHASGGDDHGNVSSGSKAIEAAEMENGFRLREQAANVLGVRFEPVNGAQISTGEAGIVRFQDYLAVYRKRDGWIRMVEVEGVSSSSGNIRFTSKDFREGDQIATRGASALRVIDMDLWGPKADACAD